MNYDLDANEDQLTRREWWGFVILLIVLGLSVGAAAMILSWLL